MDSVSHRILLLTYALRQMSPVYIVRYITCKIHSNIVIYQYYTLVIILKVLCLLVCSLQRLLSAVT